MRTRREGRPGGSGGPGEPGRERRVQVRRLWSVGLLLFLPALPALSLPDLPGLPDLPNLAAQVVTFEETVARLGSPDDDERRRALRLLVEARFPEAAEPISALLTDPQKEMRVSALAAVTSLFLLEPPANSRRVGLVFERRGQVSSETVFDLGPLAVGPGPVPDVVLTRLVDAVFDGEEQVAREAVYTLGVLGRSSPSGAEWRQTAAINLATVLQRNDRSLQLAALRVLGRLFADGRGRQPDQQAGDAVVAMMNHRDRGLRVAAIETLGALRYERAVQALVERYSDSARGEEGEAVLHALARIGHRSAAPIFMNRLIEGSNRQKRVAVEGLARTGSPEVLADIQSRLLRNDDRPVALAAAFAAARLANGPVDPIVSALGQPGFEEQAFDYLRELVRVKPAAFVVHVQDPDETLRLKLADAVALSDDAASLPIAEALMRDPIPAVAEAAARAVSWIGLRR